MASLVRPFTSHFADSLTQGDVFTVYRSGEHLMRVTAVPVIISNLIGDRRHVIVQVAKVNAPQITGQMILSPSNVIYIRHTKDPA